MAAIRPRVPRRCRVFRFHGLLVGRPGNHRALRVTDPGKLWSYADLMGLRIVSWLRHAKPSHLPASPMPEVRKALALLAERGLEMWDAAASRSPLIVDGRGSIFVRSGDVLLDSSDQPTFCRSSIWD
jgi:hypothetical protein